MTWSHPRGLNPLLALAAVLDPPYAVRGSSIHWSAQPLAGFESHPISELATSFDLIVLDHPGLGAAVSDGALVPLQELFTGTQLQGWGDQTVPGSFGAYRYDDRQWALPIDAACQVTAYRPDLLTGAPTTWDEVLDLGLGVCVPTAGPHALLTLLGICAAHAPGFEARPDRLMPPEAGAASVNLLRRLIERTDPRFRDLDPIGVLDAMAVDGVDIACCPLVFGYVTYSSAAHARRVIAFADAPSAERGGTPGSVLGGTGVAVSARRPLSGSTLEHVRQLMDPFAQRDVAAPAGGQPSARLVWDDERTNDDWLQFYRRTRLTQDSAWRRPRFDGWIAFQRQGSDVLRRALTAGHHDRDVLAAVERCYRRHRRSGALD